GGSTDPDRERSTTWSPQGPQSFLMGETKRVGPRGVHCLIVVQRQKSEFL
ncbi:unnamed protein product, partial [marine sediment metagenome]